MSETTILESFRAVHAGSTEIDIASTLTRSLYEQGTQQFKLMIVATGERSQFPNVGPTSRILLPGDICRVEIFSAIDGYQAFKAKFSELGLPAISFVAHSIGVNLHEKPYFGSTLINRLSREWY